MKFEFIANACGIFHGSKKTKLLMDPWLDDGVFEGSWCHYPPLKSTHKDFQNVDCIYISHIHPDHFDQRFFSYKKDTPIFILKNKFNILYKNLIKKGYTNIFEIESGKSLKFKEFNLTIFKPFVKNLYHEFETGNLIDSALVIEDEDGSKAFNSNDNTPDFNSCKKLKDSFGNFDLAMINYNPAGPYPSCFNNLSNKEKLKRKEEIIQRNIKHLIGCCKILEPKTLLPFAGSYVIGGKEFLKNKYLGTISSDECKKRIKLESKQKVILLRENDIFDIKNNKTESELAAFNINHQEDYIEKKLSKIKYPYEKDSEVSDFEINKLFHQSLKALNQRKKQYNLIAKSRIILKSGKEIFIVNEGNKDYDVKLECELNKKLLKRILTRKSHWNNAEIGCHITMFRSPDKYEPDAHTLLQFLHI